MVSDQSAVVARATNAAVSVREFVGWLSRSGQFHRLVRGALAEAVVTDAALRTGLIVGDVELQRASDRFRYRHGLSTAAQTSAWLAQEGVSADDFEAGLERELLVEKFKHHLAAPSAAAHFAAYRGRYAAVALRQIIAPSEEVAREFLYRLTDDGADFADLTRQYSLDGPSRLAGGSLGEVPRHTLPAAVADAVFAAAPGAVVGPVATDRGFHLFLVEAFPEPVLDDATAAVIREELFGTWLAEQLKDVRIDLTGLSSSE